MHFLLAVLFLAIGASAEERFVFEKAEMGVPFRLTFYAPDQARAQQAADATFAHLEMLNGILSDYEDDSELTRLSRTSGTGKSIPVSSILWKVLERSHELATRSDGAFDITIGPLANLWRRVRRKRELPSRELLEEMRARVGYRFMQLDPRARAVTLQKPDMRLDLGGIAKGFAADEAIATLAKFGITRALAAASGDIVAGDPPPGEPGWRVQVPTLEIAGAPPAEVLLLAHAAVSTSGDTYQYVEIDGVRYSHIIDPRTGLGLTDHSLVTVVAPDGLTADGLDTTIDLLGPRRGLALLQHYPRATARLLRAPAGKVEAHESPGWRELPRAAPQDSNP